MTTKYLDDTTIYDEIKKHRTGALVVLLTSRNCHACWSAERRMEKVAKKYGFWYSFATMKRQDAPKLTQALGITLYPSLIMFKGGKCTSIRQGAMNLAEIDRWLGYA